LKNPERVAVSRPGEVADKITQEVHFVAGAAKTDFLIEKLAEHRGDAAIVFARTKHGSERLMKTLSKAGLCHRFGAWQQIPRPKTACH
jgi:ATP-dependent RNA helicase RhlE